MYDSTDNFMSFSAYQFTSGESLHVCNKKRRWCKTHGKTDRKQSVQYVVIIIWVVRSAVKYSQK